MSESDLGTVAERVGDLVRRRRLSLGLTQQQAAQLADVGSTTWRLLEKAQQDTFLPLKLANISRSLGWPEDGLERLLAGEDPGPWVSATPADTARIDALEARMRGVESKLDDLADSISDLGDELRQRP